MHGPTPLDRGSAPTAPRLAHRAPVGRRPQVPSDDWPATDTATSARDHARPPHSADVPTNGGDAVPVLKGGAGCRHGPGGRGQVGYHRRLDSPLWTRRG